MSCKKVLFLTDGGSRIGMGHVTRCRAVADGVAALGGCARIVVNGDMAVEQYLGADDRRADWFQVDILEPLLKEADAVFVDSYNVSDALLSRIASERRTVFFDDTIRTRYPAPGIVINGTAGAELFRFSGTAEVVAGCRYIPLRKPFWEGVERAISQELSQVLVVLGGADPLRLGWHYARMVRDTFENVHVVLVSHHSSGGDDHGIEVLQGLSAAEMRDLMLQSDMALSAGGQTLYELAATGTPAVAVMVADNQRYNVDGLHRAGIVRYAGWADSSLESARRHLCEMQGAHVRGMMSMKALTAVDGQGAKRVATLLLGD